MTLDRSGQGPAGGATAGSRRIDIPRQNTSGSHVVTEAMLGAPLRGHVTQRGDLERASFGARNAINRPQSYPDRGAREAKSVYAF
jgi:hypothetical protein